MKTNIFIENHKLEKLNGKLCDNTKNSIEFVFLSFTLETGGIGTLVVRMANQIANAGYRVTVFGPYGDLCETLLSKINLIILKEKNVFKANISESFVPHSDTKTVYFWASLPGELFPLFLLQRKLWKSYEISSYSVSGIFHPRVWRKEGQSLYRRLFSRLMQAAMPLGSIYFMNESSRNSHIEVWGQHLSKWPVHKLAMNEIAESWENTNEPTLKIVSVGRLTPFKAYNFGAVDVAETLKSKNIPFIWHIWGDGEDYEKLNKLIQEKNLVDHLILMGNLPYSQFISTIKKYDLFVGMGTAAIEAAQISMPTILAIDQMPVGTYGFFFEAPLDSIGERIPGTDIQNLFDNVLNCFELSLEKRKEIGLLCRNAVIDRVGGEKAPFVKMFHAGIKVPDQSAKNYFVFLISTMKFIRTFACIFN